MAIIARRHLVLALPLLVLGCARPAGDQPPAVATTILPGPEGNREAFEPSLAIDPADPRRIVVAAMYGNPSARGGRAIWTWETGDGGRSWSNGRMRPAVVGSKPATWAADVIAGIARDGAAVLTSMAGADEPKTDGLGGIIVSRRAKGDSSFGVPVQVMPDQLIPGADRALSYDKPWMTIDRHPSSPHNGTVYVIAGALDLKLPARSWSTTPIDMSDIVMLGLDFTVSRDDGQSFGPPRRVADSVFGADLAVSPTGSLEVVYPKITGGTSAISHLRSTDGGVTFEPPVEVVTANPGSTVGGPLVARRPDGDLMVCWSETSAERAIPRLRCAERRPGGGWASATAHGVVVPLGTTFAFPTLVGTAKAWYLLIHLIDSTRTEVALFRSLGGGAFSRVATLATIPGLGLPQWCFARQCRFERADLFMPGDYAALGVAGGQLAAAYVLPRPGGSLFGRAAVYLSTITEP